MTLTLPYPPILNRYYTHFRGHVQLSAEGRAYKQTALVMGRGQGLKPLDGKVRLTIELYRRARRGDIDGALKATLDALQHVAYTNDSQIRELHVFQEEDAAEPRVVITAEPWTARELRSLPTFDPERVFP